MQPALRLCGGDAGERSGGKTRLPGPLLEDQKADAVALAPRLLCSQII
jgi:hypothetical protein